MDRLPRIVIPSEQIVSPKPFGDTLDQVAYDREGRSSTGRFRLDGFTGRIGLHDQPELLAEFNLRFFATKYASAIKKVFAELRIHDGPYAPTVLFDQTELLEGDESVTVSFNEPHGRKYHGAEVTIVSKNAAGTSSSIKFGVLKQY